MFLSPSQYTPIVQMILVDANCYKFTVCIRFEL